MAEGGPGRGRGGRGAIIAKLLELEKRPGQPPPSLAGDVPPPAPPSGDGPPPIQKTTQAFPIRPGGRGAILQRLQQAQQALGTASSSSPVVTPVQETTSSPLPSAPQSIEAPIQVSRGRGRVLQHLGLQMGQQSSTVPVKASSYLSHQLEEKQPVPGTSAKVEQKVEDVTKRMKKIEITSDRPPVIMRGTDGQEIPATANYIPLYLQPGRGIFEYEVRFTPPVDDRVSCDRMLFVQHKEILGRRRTFDGVTLYVPHKLPDEATQLTSTHPVTNETHTVSLIFRRERSMGECTHMYNVLFNNIQKELSLVRLGREYFSPNLAHMIPQHRLEVWPGYITAVDAFEGGIMLNCNASHKVLRNMTVLDLMQEIITQTKGVDWQNILQKSIIGQSVMIRNPVKMYRVDDIDFNLNPSSSFQRNDGTSMTYVEYHLRKGIEIKDLRQPLLVHRPKPSKRELGSGLLMLIPELCYLTGLTDEMRADFKVMKDVAMYTRVNPNQRLRTLQTFINNIRGNENCVRLLDEWGLKVPESTTDLTARVLNPEPLYFGRNFVDKGSVNADWGNVATRQHMLEVEDIYSWMVVHTQRDERNARDFVEMMAKVCPQMGVRIEYPAVHKIRDDRTETYLRELKAGLNPDLQLVVVIFPSSRDDRYSAIKKLCCVDKPIPSQVINSRTISKPEKLRSIVQKIALQINCKLGGALWAVKIPFKNAMICGIDTHHDSKNKSMCVAGFVASMNPSVTRWHSQVFIQSSDREMVDGLRIALMTAIHKYSEVNKMHPDTIIVFRDGVGDGQLKVCEENEVQTMKRAFISVSPDYNPSLAFIVCQKRINTRIFIPKRNDFENPPPGSVVDHTITRRYLYDFFLVSQLVRQGTVTPTHYIVLYNNTRLDPDKMQKLTYKMCHLYYNWPGTIRVPAPCQYAHKLAFLVGSSIHKEPAQVLCDKLFFL